MLKKKSIFCFVLIFSLIFTTVTFAKKETVKKVANKTGRVVASYLNIRQGPGINHKVISIIEKGTKVRVLGKKGSWYIIYCPKKDLAGAVSGEYIKIYNNTISGKTNAVKPTPKPTAVAKKTNKYSKIKMTDSEKLILKLVNKVRKKHGLKAVTANKKLIYISRLKAEDMVNNNYFGHNSKKYGTAFDMMKKHKIKYGYAGENIAGNEKARKAFWAWMKSKNHKANILNEKFTKMGIGEAKSSKYGNIFVQMFTD